MAFGRAARIVFACALASTAASAQLPLDIASSITASEAGIQSDSDVDMQPSGRFTVVWREGGTALDLKLRSANTDGTGDPVLELTTTDTAQDPAIATMANGIWIATWRSDQNPDAGSDVWGRLSYDLGQTLEDEFQLNSTESTDAVGHGVTIDEQAIFVGFWKSASDPTLVRYRVFGNQTDPFTNDETANQTSATNTGAPSVAKWPDNKVFVVWAGVGETDDDIVGRCFTDSGTPFGDEFPIAEESAGVDSSPRVGVDGSGIFSVAWINNQNGAASLVLRRFDVFQQPIGGDHAVASLPAATADFFDFDVAADGAAVVAFETHVGDADGGVAVLELTKSGQPVGGAFLVANATPGLQNDPAVAIGDRHFVAAWTEPGASPGVTHVFYRPYLRRVIFTDDFEFDEMGSWSNVAP